MKTVEETIVDLMEAGDKKAIGMIYDYYSDALYGIVKRIIRDDEQAKDVMQESFIKVWKNIDRYDPSKAKLFTWLLRIFRNSAIDQLRKSQKFVESKIQKDDAFVITKTDSEFNPDVMDISVHLQGLDYKFRTVIEKIYMHGRTQCEASDELGIPLGTVKSRTRLGLKALRKIYLPMLILLIAFI